MIEEELFHAMKVEIRKLKSRLLPMVSARGGIFSSGNSSVIIAVKLHNKYSLICGAFEFSQIHPNLGDQNKVKSHF